MTGTGKKAARGHGRGYAWLAGGSAAAAGTVAMIVAAQSAGAATAPVGLGTAGSFAVLAGQTVTNTGPSTISGDLGVSPGSAVTGFPPGIVTNGTIHAADGVANGAQSDLTTAYNDAAGRSPTANVPAFIGAGQTLAPGVYKASSSLDVGGSLTLDAGGDPNAVFVFQAPSTLVTDSASSVTLTGGAQACNVYWQVGSSATLGTNSSFTGTVLALTSISVQTGDTIAGRALARNGAVTLDDDTITASSCSITPPPTSPPPTTGAPTTPPPTTGAPTTPPPTRTGPPTPTPTPTGTGTTPGGPGTGPAPTPTPVISSLPVTG
jgi:Ice-binding-like